MLSISDRWRENFNSQKVSLSKERKAEILRILEEDTGMVYVRGNGPFFVSAERKIFDATEVLSLGCQIDFYWSDDVHDYYLVTLAGKKPF